MTWFVYILLCDQKTFYIGITQSLRKRIWEHVSGYSPTTKKFSVIELVYGEKYKTRAEAERREVQLKDWSVAKKKALIAGDRDSLIKLSKSHGLVDATGEKW